MVLTVFFSNIPVHFSNPRAPRLGARISIAAHAELRRNLVSAPSSSALLSHPGAPRPTIYHVLTSSAFPFVWPAHTRGINMEAYSRIRQDSLVHYTRERRRSGFFRQSWEFLSRFLDKRQDHDLSHQYQRGLAIDYSSTGSSETSLLPPTGESEFGDVQSVTTFASSATLDEKALENKLIEDASIRSLVPVHRGKFADSAALGDKKLKPVRPALPPSLGMTGTEITQIDIRLQNGQSITWRKRMGILEVPETVRKNIWRNAVVNDKKLFICNC